MGGFVAMTLEEKKESIAHIWQKRCEEFPWLRTNTIFLSIHGSVCYGLDVETSDVDFTGICIPPKPYFLGWLHELDQIQFNKAGGDGADGQIYGIKKFFRLAADNNPNVLELLYIPEKFHIISTWRWSI